MIAYISQFISMAAAIIGVLLSPRYKNTKGEEVFSPWVWVFIILPIIGFSISAISTYNDEQQKIAEKYAAIEAASKDRADAAAARKELAELQGRVKKSLERVDYLEVDLRFEIEGKELEWSTEGIRSIHDFFDFYAIAKSKGDGYIYSLASEMYDNWHSTNRDEREMFSYIYKALMPMSRAGGATLFLRHRQDEPLAVIASKILESAPFNFYDDIKKIAPDVVSYPVDNPAAGTLIPSMPTVFSSSNWIIPDKNADLPSAIVVWLNRLANNRNLSFYSKGDFEDIEAVIWVPRPNPDFDPSPSLGSYYKAFGTVASVDLDIGGLHWGWNPALKDNLIHLNSQGKRASSENADSTIGYLITLQSGQRGVL